jgi:hypothetical protein
MAWLRNILDPPDNVVTYVLYGIFSLFVLVGGNVPTIR